MREIYVTLRLPTGAVTVLLGPEPARRRMMAALDDSSGRCAAGRDSAPIRRLAAGPGDGVAERLEAVDEVRAGSASIVLVDGFTDGLPARDRRALLTELRSLARGRAVLVHDTDPVAALAVADGALRVDGAGGLAYEAVAELDYLGS